MVIAGAPPTLMTSLLLQSSVTVPLSRSIEIVLLPSVNSIFFAFSSSVTLFPFAVLTVTISSPFLSANRISLPFGVLMRKFSFLPSVSFCGGVACFPQMLPMTNGLRTSPPSNATRTTSPTFGMKKTPLSALANGVTTYAQSSSFFYPAFVPVHQTGTSMPEQSKLVTYPPPLMRCVTWFRK